MNCSFHVKDFTSILICSNILNLELSKIPSKSQNVKKGRATLITEATYIA